MSKSDRNLLTPAEEAQLKAITAQLALMRIIVGSILAYGVYEYFTAYTPLTIWIYGFMAWLAWGFRPVMPANLKNKLKRIRSAG